MPSYKTHSIHGEMVLPHISDYISVNPEDLKSFCMGPDAMILTDYSTFKRQHSFRTKDYFINLIKTIKKNKLQENKEVMAFLYGQLDHFVLDSTMHPFIYYMTEDLKLNYKIDTHAIIEGWIDEYVCDKYHKNDVFYYNRLLIIEKKLVTLINKTYRKIYGVCNEGIKYSIGMFFTILFDSLLRRNILGFVPIVTKIGNIGDITYSDINRVKPYLNLDKKKWFNPETREEYNDSFDDLWNKSIDLSIETINDVNGYLYLDKSIRNSLILKNISMDTGRPCEEGQKLRYIKKYRKNKKGRNNEK